MKTIATFSKAEDAHLMRMRLGSAGIEAFVQDEHMAQIEQPVTLAMGGVRVQVAEGDYDVAKEYLAADEGVGLGEN